MKGVRPVSATSVSPATEPSGTGLRSLFGGKFCAAEAAAPRVAVARAAHSIGFTRRAIMYFLHSCAERRTGTTPVRSRDQRAAGPSHPSRIGLAGGVSSALDTYYKRVTTAYAMLVPKRTKNEGKVEAWIGSTGLWL